VGAITLPFVEDLIRRKLINGPEPVQKRDGRGRGQRFKPRDYRDLLELIRLKLGGVKHRSAWLFQLWLRGHEYPIEDVRRALIGEVQVAIHSVMTDFAPTGRFTEPFGVKFARRVRGAQGDNEISDFLEPLVAKMMRPGAIAEITPSVDRMTAELAALSGVDGFRLRAAVAELVEGLKGNTGISSDSQGTLSRAFSATSFGPLFDLMRAAKSADFAKMQAGLEGALDDGSGSSKLVDALRCAGEQKLREVRKFAWPFAAGL
jgi:hypothetical protein